MKWTRNQYMRSDCTHREYYAQFVTEQVKEQVRRYIGLDSIKGSTDPHFNDIRLGHWDRIPVPTSVAYAMKEAGDWLSPAGKVCILKEAARQLAEQSAAMSTAVETITGIQPA